MIEELAESLKNIDNSLQSLFNYYIQLRTAELVDQKYSEDTYACLERIDNLITERAQIITEALYGGENHGDGMVSSLR